ncbi:hypothetical protein BH10BDE1_BH10BDE1_14810 [soil metagenome]
MKFPTQTPKISQSLIQSLMMTFALIATVLTVSMVASDKAFAATERKGPKEVEIKIQPIHRSDAELEKSQEDRMSAVNQALNQALDERAKSQSAYERHNDRAAARPDVSDREMRSLESNLDARETRAMNRDNREDQRREKRLNWLND